MTKLAVWTWVAAGVLIALPPVIFVLFLRDARRVLEDIGVDRPRRDAASSRKEAA
jgi:hypothetical protein